MSVQRQPQAALTVVLYAPKSRPIGKTAEMRAIMYGERDWQRTRYKDNTESRPKEPEQLCSSFWAGRTLERPSRLQLGWQKVPIRNRRITLKLTNSTLMSCQPDSLASLSAESGCCQCLFHEDGRLFLSLSNDTGTMEFDRPALQANRRP